MRQMLKFVALTMGVSFSLMAESSVDLGGQEIVMTRCSKEPSEPCEEEDKCDQSTSSAEAQSESESADTVLLTEDLSF